MPGRRWVGGGLAVCVDFRRIEGLERRPLWRKGTPTGVKRRPCSKPKHLMNQGEFLRGIGDSLGEFAVGRHLVRQLSGRARDEPPLHLDDGRPLASEPRRDVGDGAFGLDDVSAREDVHGRVSVFRPGVDREMRFRDNHDPADAEGIEFMKRHVDNRGPARTSGTDQDILDDVHFLQRVWVTTVEFDQQVSAQSVQCTPPFRPVAGCGATRGPDFFRSCL
jgi:hypothetical protein